MHLCAFLVPSARLQTGRALQLIQGRSFTRRYALSSLRSVQRQLNAWEWDIREPLGSAPAFAVLFEAPMLGGRCVGVKLPSPLLPPSSSSSFSAIKFSDDVGAADASTNLQGMTTALWAELHPQEAALARSLLTPNKSSAGDNAYSESDILDSTVVAQANRFCGGRLAARRALAAALLPMEVEQARLLEAALGPVLKGARGEPVFQGIRGIREGAALSSSVISSKNSGSGHASVSISHKDDVAVALVQTLEGQTEGESSARVVAHLGIDIEDLRGRRGSKTGSSGSNSSSSSTSSSTSSGSGFPDSSAAEDPCVDALSPRAQRLAKRVLTARELERLGELVSCGLSKDDEVLVIFSFKEAAYKAMDPILRRFVGWQEVEVHPSTDGTASLTFLGKQETADSHEGSEGSSSSSSSSSGVSSDEEAHFELAGQWRRVGVYVATAVEAFRKMP